MQLSATKVQFAQRGQRAVRQADHGAHLERWASTRLGDRSAARARRGHPAPSRNRVPEHTISDRLVSFSRELTWPGHFDVDPLRALDIVLGVFSNNLVYHHSIFRELIALITRRPSPHVYAASLPSLPTDSLPEGHSENAQGDLPCAQILGFKFQHYGPDGPGKGDIVPSKLYLAAAILIGDGVVRLADLYPHLHPADSALSAEYRDAQKNAGKVGPSAQNALSMAKPLDGVTKAGADDAGAKGDEAVKEIASGLLNGTDDVAGTDTVTAVKETVQTMVREL